MLVGALAESFRAVVQANPACKGRDVGSGISRSIGDCAWKIAKLPGKEDLEPTIGGQFRHGDIRYCTADIAMARKLL